MTAIQTDIQTAPRLGSISGSQDNQHFCADGSFMRVCGNRDTETGPFSANDIGQGCSNTIAPMGHPTASKGRVS